MSIIDNKIILLTGCINPNGMTKTVIQDPEARKQQYILAINYYLNNTHYPIIFIENTNTDISGGFEQCVNNKRIEFITFNGNDFNKALGKGYGEAIMIDYAIKKSILIQESSFIIKITGRLIVENIEELTSEMKLSNCVYANMVRGNCGLERKSFFFGASVKFLRDYFLANKECIDESINVYFERHLYNECLIWKEAGGLSKEFKHPIIVKGVSGSTGKDYPIEKHPRIKALLRYYFHKLPIYRNM